MGNEPTCIINICHIPIYKETRGHSSQCYNRHSRGWLAYRMNRFIQFFTHVFTVGCTGKYKGHFVELCHQEPWEEVKIHTSWNRSFLNGVLTITVAKTTPEIIISCCIIWLPLLDLSHLTKSHVTVNYSARLDIINTIAHPLNLTCCKHNYFISSQYNYATHYFLFPTIYMYVLTLLPIHPCT